MFWFVYVFVREELPCFFEHVVLSGFDEFKCGCYGLNYNEIIFLMLAFVVIFCHW